MARQLIIKFKNVWNYIRIIIWNNKLVVRNIKYVLKNDYIRK